MFWGSPGSAGERVFYNMARDPHKWCGHPLRASGKIELLRTDMGRIRVARVVPLQGPSQEAYKGKAPCVAR